MKNVVGPEGLVVSHITKIGEVRDNQERYPHLDLKKEGMKKYSFLVWSQGPNCHDINGDCKEEIEAKREALIIDVKSYYI